MLVKSDFLYLFILWLNALPSNDWTKPYRLMNSATDNGFVKIVSTFHSIGCQKSIWAWFFCGHRQYAGSNQFHGSCSRLLRSIICYILPAFSANKVLVRIDLVVIELACHLQLHSRNPGYAGTMISVVLEPWAVSPVRYVVSLKGIYYYYMFNALYFFLSQ